MTNSTLTPLVDLLKALAHPVRLRVLALLRGGEVCVCQIAETLGIPRSTVSEHLTELRRAGLLAERRDGRWVHCTLRPRPGLEALVADLWPHLEPVDQILRDASALAAIREVPVEITCSGTRGCSTQGPRRAAHAQ